jgi:asparagine synthase (glutamine-hydrolysing)
VCGIAGVWNTDPSNPVDESLILPIADVLHHRGPDQWGYRVGCGSSALLLSTRLAIVDLANGRQPLTNEDGSVWVVLNGEIYDFARIARTLEQAGHRFRTRSDTEVIVHLYEEHGENFVEIRVANSRSRCSTSDRPALPGARPLRDQAAVLRRSAGRPRVRFRDQALFQHPQVRRTLNRRRVFQTLHGLLVPGETYFEGVRDLEPGHLLRVTRSASRSGGIGIYRSTPGSLRRLMSRRPSGSITASSARTGDCGFMVT